MPSAFAESRDSQVTKILGLLEEGQRVLLSPSSQTGGSWESCAEGCCARGSYTSGVLQTRLTVASAILAMLVLSFVLHIHFCFHFEFQFWKCVSKENSPSFFSFCLCASGSQSKQLSEALNDSLRVVLPFKKIHLKLSHLMFIRLSGLGILFALFGLSLFCFVLACSIGRNLQPEPLVSVLG